VPEIDWKPEHYICYRTDTPIVVDGHMKEDSWQAVPWTAAFVDIEGDIKPRPRHRTRAKMIWDDTYFYVAAELEEPHLWATLTERDAVIYHDNDFEVFIDPDGDTHEYYELEINAFGTEWDLLLIKPYRDGGPAVNAWDIQGLQTAVALGGTLNDPRDRDTGWSVEIAIPWDVLAECAHRSSPPEPGDQWRVNFSRVQWRLDVTPAGYEKRRDASSGKPLPEDNWVWSPQGLIAMHYPEMWGFVQFSGRVAGLDVDLFEPRPVETARWGLRTLYYRQRMHFDEHGGYASDIETLGLADVALPGWDWPPALHATPELFEAVVTRDDGFRLHISQDGHIW